MDDLEAIYNLNRDKALGVLTVSGNLIIFTIVTIISVFIPLAFTLARNSPELMILFQYFIVFCPMVLIPVYGFFFFKYREYKNLYKIALIKSIVQNYFKTSSSTGQTPDYDMVCKEVVRVMELDYDYTMNMLFEIYPPPKTTPIISK